MPYVTSQPSLRDSGYLRRNPTLERVGYSQISLWEIGVGYSRNPLRKMSVGNSSSDCTTAHGRKMSKLYKLYTPLASEFSCPDTETSSLKTTENQLLEARILTSIELHYHFGCLHTSGLPQSVKS